MVRHNLSLRNVVLILKARLIECPLELSAGETLCSASLCRDSQSVSELYTVTHHKLEFLIPDSTRFSTSSLNFAMLLGVSDAHFSEVPCNTSFQSEVMGYEAGRTSLMHIGTGFSITFIGVRLPEEIGHPQILCCLLKQAICPPIATLPTQTLLFPSLLTLLFFDLKVK